jgi:hypothetical protein
MIEPLIQPIVIEHRAEAPRDAVIIFAGRPMRIVKSYGNDPAAPVILEELVRGKNYSAGQYTMWSMWAAMRALAKGGTL